MTIESIQTSFSTSQGAFRIVFVRDQYLDADARCACRIISSLPGIDSNFISINEPSTPILLREFARLFRHRNKIDLLITAGRHASRIGKHWPDHWLDIGTTNHRGHVRPARVGLTIEPSNAARAGNADRASVRKQLGVADSDRLIYAPGRVSYQSHFTAFHASSILHFSDPRYRLVVEDDDQSWLDSMARKLEQSKLLVKNPALNDSDLARAADIALIAPGENIARVPIAQVIASKVPIVVARNRYTNWLDEIAERVDPPKPRLLVKAIMRLFENPPDAERLDFAKSWIERKFNFERAQVGWTQQMVSCQRT